MIRLLHRYPRLRYLTLKEQMNIENKFSKKRRRVRMQGVLGLKKIRKRVLRVEK